MRVAEPLSDLYEADETAWLEAMAELIADGRTDELDHANLQEYLSSMARRDKREVKNRLALLVAHVLKWSHQPDQRTASWRTTMALQRKELQSLCKSKSLRKHAEDVLAQAYLDGVDLAAAETGLPDADFPRTCPYTLALLLSGDVLEKPDPPSVNKNRRGKGPARTEK